MRLPNALWFVPVLLGCTLQIAFACGEGQKQSAAAVREQLDAALRPGFRVFDKKYGPQIQPNRPSGVPACVQAGGLVVIALPPLSSIPPSWLTSWQPVMPVLAAHRKE
jgi:hypothetical protein